MKGIVHGDCPVCHDHVEAWETTRKCLICGTVVHVPAEEPKPRKRRKSRLSDAHLVVLHKAHIEQGRSINSLARDIWRKVGYASQVSCCTAICNGFKALALPSRDRIEQVKLTCTVHGLAPKHGSRVGYIPYSRKTGKGKNLPPLRPSCRGVRQTAPDKGAPCERPAQDGSAWCWSHDPERAGQRRRIVERMWAQQPDREMLPVEPFAEWLTRHKDDLGITFAQFGERLGVSHHAIRRYTNRTVDRVSRDTVERWAEAEAVAFEDIYQSTLSVEAA